ncbi:hypothetical protein RYZ26_17605 [Terasakiella sp. A23]|uniref:hypothetical protein n=1 Tax=Terasakiella sp. FCG-A23 TaxID=3080561 RepID=UPI0029531FAA|nr:hypothetical protein [Terasakiella sp. A23]MDV7341429.1 hypothetical protein [Terasakiella sp. A23]
MRFLAWVIMAAVFLITFVLSKDLLMSFGAQLIALFIMLVFGKQFFFGEATNPDIKKED